MPSAIPAAHPLRLHFAAVTERCFLQRLGWPEVEVIRYVVDLLVDFAHSDHLDKIRNAQGRRMEDVVEMLMEGDLLLRADSLERRQRVNTHIGDYTLFMTGLFPEFLHRMKRAQVVISPDAFLDFVATGARSYRIASECALGGRREGSSLLRKLSENFELCVYGLGHVRGELERLRHRTLRQVWGTLLR
jgi:hypothetical protein